LSQIWAQVAAHYYEIPNVQCYLGGTEVTELFPKIAETLSDAGFEVWKLSETKNPVYAIKFDENTLPLIGFSKKYDDPFNPERSFAAVMTVLLPMKVARLFPSRKRVPLTFEDPKVSDNTPQQTEV
jgi:arsenate reductase